MIAKGRNILLGGWVIAMASTFTFAADEIRETSIRAGSTRTITSIKRIPQPKENRKISDGGVAGEVDPYPFPRPRFVGFSPLVAITTSDQRRTPFEFVFEHDIESRYVGNLLNGTSNQNFVIGILDTGAVVDLAAGSGAEILGLTGPFLTENILPLGGVGGSLDALITQPVAIFAAGLSSVNNLGLLDFDAVVGHSNASLVAAPPISCGTGEVISAVIGTPFLSFFNTVIRVDTPVKVNAFGKTFFSPDVTIQQGFVDIPIAHSFSMEVSGSFPNVTTANFFPDLEDLETPIVPTMLSLAPFALPTSGVYFVNVLAREGPADFNNFPTSMRMMVDTGAQSSIISPAMAANLNLPFEPDFTVDVCGVGGSVSDIPGYWVDYVKISALGGPLEYSKVPFIVLDLLSPEGGSLDGVLGMNMFWNRNVVLEPNLSGSSFFSVSAPIPVAFGDNDVDFDVDESDAAYFIDCMTAPDSGAANPECLHLDIDEDDDVDIFDFSAFQRCYSGFDVTADPACGL